MRSVGRSNWRGLTKMETKTWPFGPIAWRAFRKRLRCPSWSAPMVGTKAMGVGVLCRVIRRSAMEEEVFMNDRRICVSACDARRATLNLGL